MTYKGHWVMHAIDQADQRQREMEQMSSSSELRALLRKLEIGASEEPCSGARGQGFFYPVAKW